MTLAKRIKEARDGTGLTQATAAVRLHTSAASLAAYEQGARDVPDATLEAMAELYGTSAPMLRYGDEVLRAAAIGEVERRIREAAGSLQRAAAALLSTVPGDTARAVYAADKPMPTEPPDAAPVKRKRGRSA